MDNIEVDYVARTDRDIDNSRFVAKVPYTVTDEYGNVATLYRKEDINVQSLLDEKSSLEEQLAIVNSKLLKIGQLGAVK